MTVASELGAPGTPQETAERVEPRDPSAFDPSLVAPKSDASGDGRAAPRRRVLLTGKLTYGDGLSMDCAIREESDTGARVVVGAQLLPRHVVLVSVTRGMAYEAQVMWRRGKEAGLQFLKTHPLKSEAPEPSSQVDLARRLWSETLARGSD